MHLRICPETLILLLLLLVVQPLVGHIELSANLTTSSVQVAHSQQQSPKPYALILCFVPLLTVFGNALVILAVYRERSLQTATNFLIVSLAVSDFLVATCVMSFAIYFEWNSFVWDLGSTLCNLFIGVDVACSTASILNLFSITLDRYMAISHPLAYTQYGTNNARALLSICIVWGISIAVGLPVFFGANNKANEDNQEKFCEFNNAYFIIISSLLSFFAPCAIMILLYTVIFRRLKQREKARYLRNMRKSRKSAAINTLGAARLENEKISSALLTGARMARQMGNHFKIRGDQMLMDLSLQTSSFPTASPSLSEDLYGSRMNGGLFSKALAPPPTLLDSSFSRLSFSSIQQYQQGSLKRSNTVPLSKSIFLTEKSSQVSTNLSTAEVRKSRIKLCDNMKESNYEDLIPQLIKDISQMVEEAIQEGLKISSAPSPKPTKKWVSFGENLYGSFPFIDSLSNGSDSLCEVVIGGSVAVMETYSSVCDQTTATRLQRHSSYCCAQENSGDHRRIRSFKSINSKATPSLISLPVTQLDAQEAKKISSEETTCPVSPDHQLPILNGKVMHIASPPSVNKPSSPSSLFKRTSASVKAQRRPIRMSVSNGNLRLTVKHQLSLPLQASSLISGRLNHHFQLEPKSSSCCTSLGEADESTNYLATITPTANNRKLSSTETLPSKVYWKGMVCCCSCQKVDSWLAGWTQSSKRSNESSTTPGCTTITSERSPRIKSIRSACENFKSTRSQPSMSRDTNNNNKEKENFKKRTDSWRKAFKQCDEVWRRVTTNLGQSMILKGVHGGSKSRDHRAHRPSRQLIKKASKQMKREHKATVTLAVVLGVFLVCWVPFFTIHLTNAICMLMEKENCVHFLATFLTTWLGYLNSSMNPLVYTLFDIRFRKAFRNIIYCQK